MARKKIFLILFAIIVFAVPTAADALLGDLVDFSSGAILKIILIPINLLVDLFGLVVIGVAASLVNYVFQFQNFIKVPVVQIGWTLSRDLANMAFIMVMLVMAFGTVLRLESYGWKKMLPRLVAVAILINFSLVICGVFIDFGNSIGKFFISGGRQGTVLTTGVGDFIMTAVAAGQVAQLRNNVGSFGEATASLIMASVVQLIFYLVLAFMLLALAFIMIFRMINLWLLLIMAPLAWVASFVPGFSSYFSSWKKKFFDWAMFPAVMGFFIFLGLLAGATLQSGSATLGAGGPDVGGFWSYIFPEAAFSAVMQFIIVVAILMTGLVQAKSLSGLGASSMMKIVGDAQKWGQGKLKAAGRTGAGAAGLAAKVGADKLLAKSDVLSRAGLGSLGQIQERMEKIPGVGRAIGGPGARFAAQQKSIKDAEGKLKGLRPQDLRAILEQTVLTPEGQARRAGALSQLADKNQLKDEDKVYIKDFQVAGGNIKDLLEHRLDWAFDEMIQNMMSKDFNFPKIADDWKKVTALASDSTKRWEEAAKAIQDVIPKKPEDMVKLQKDTITVTSEDTESAKKAKEEIKRLITEEFKEVNSITGKMGRLTAASLNSMAHKNPETYYQMILHLKQPVILDETRKGFKLKEDVRQHIISGPLPQVLGPEAASPTPATATPGTTPPP